MAISSYYPLEMEILPYNKPLIIESFISVLCTCLITHAFLGIIIRSGAGMEMFLSTKIWSKIKKFFKFERSRTQHMVEDIFQN